MIGTEVEANKSMDHQTGFGLFFLIGGLLFVYGAWEQAVRKRALLRRAVRVKARITDVREETGDAESVDSYYPTVAFRIGDEEVRTEVVRGGITKGEFRRGRSIMILYDPLNPKSAVLKPRDWEGGIVGIVMGLIAAGIGGGLLYLSPLFSR